MPTNPCNRRESLAGELVKPTDASAAATPSDPPVTTAPAVEAASYLLHIGRTAMACPFELYFNAGQYPQATEAALETLDLIQAIEAQITVYRSDSELSCLNRAGGFKPVLVEPQLFQLLKQAAQLTRDSDGAYDITSGPLSKVWGFSRRESRIPEPTELAAALRRVGSENLIFDDQAQTIHFRSTDVEINLGSIGKGYAIDRGGQLLRERGIENFLFHGGSSSILACGGRQGNDGWTVGIRHPLLPTRRLAEIRLRNQALGTSGAANQFFLHRGKRYGHILDPRTGWPADQVLSATVVAPTAAQGDSLSTAFYVMGAELTRQYCQSHPDVAACIITSGTRGRRVTIHTYGFADEAFQLLSAD